ncbi:hypothetical protein H1C71_031036 [Ictidomys tridecemlineatus]|nr:hypothetical protein H1C71_031036 [Ictidomys tridecemlineatus]
MAELESRDRRHSCLLTTTTNTPNRAAAAAETSTGTFTAHFLSLEQSEAWRTSTKGCTDRTGKAPQPQWPGGSILSREGGQNIPAAACLTSFYTWNPPTRPPRPSPATNTHQAKPKALTPVCMAECLPPRSLTPKKGRVHSKQASQCL